MHSLRYQQELPTSLEQAWQFLSAPENLKVITPPYLDFQITNDVVGRKMYPGMIITYTIRPLLRLPIRWVTEITHVREPYYFVDEQRFGPYAFWHHQHHLEEVSAGVRMTDEVSYRLPFGPLGDLLHSAFVRKQLTEIFTYRRERLATLFVKESTEPGIHSSPGM